MPLAPIKRTLFRGRLRDWTTVAVIAASVALRSTSAKPHPDVKAAPGLADTVVLIIRHAEKPDHGTGLAPEGEQRAKLLPELFNHLEVNGKPFRPDYLVAAADSNESHRPRLTLKPLSKTLGLTIDDRFGSKETAALAEELGGRPHGKAILICWRHGEIDRLVDDLGGDPLTLLPDGRWPEENYDWMIALTYDHEGKLTDARRLEEKLTPQTSR